MPYLPTAAAWLSQSSLLLQARPTTTKISTRYSLHKKKPTPSPIETSTTADAAAPSKPPKPPKPAMLVLKTYDPVSGTCLKYKTEKAAEVGRLVASLGRAGRIMAGLPVGEDTITGDASTTTAPTTKDEGTGANTPVPEASGKANSPAEGKTGGGGGGGRKKRGKGKR